MNSKARLLMAVATGGFVLAACDSIKDVRDEPFTAIPTPTVVLQGTINGLATRRPLVLRNDNGTSVVELPFLGTLGQTTSPFSFGSVPAGTAYSVTVASQPFGKICTVNNGSGTVTTAEAMNITVDCVNDPAVPRFSVSGTISSAVSAIETAKVTLTTEEGVWEQSAFGQSSFTFPDVIFNSQTSLPIFTWRVSATTEEGGTLNNCSVSNGTNDAGDNTTAPTGNVTNVAVTTCRYAIRANVTYLAPPGGSSAAMGAGGVTLGLRDFAGEPVAGAPDVTLTAFSGASVQLWPDMLSHANANYDLVVTEHPAGQACVVRVHSSTGSGGSAVYTTHGSVVWLSDPLEASRFTPTNIGIRCRNLPAVDRQLTGVYQRIGYNSLSPPQINQRNFVSFFADGTFLYGAHVGSSATSGVEHGFYDYDPVQGLVSFNVVTDSSSGGGFSSAPGYSRTVSSGTGLGGSISGVALQKTAAPSSTLALTFNDSSVWEWVEPKSVASQMTGPWVSPDNRRVWVFNFDDTTGIHFGVNSIINIQDGCYVFDDPATMTGYYTRRGASTGCMWGAVNDLYASGFATIDSPSAASAPLDFFGKFPGAQGALDGRPPSPNFFEITAGSPDTLTVQGSLNGVPRGPLTTFIRASVN